MRALCVATLLWVASCGKSQSDVTAAPTDKVDAALSSQAPSGTAADRPSTLRNPEFSSKGDPLSGWSGMVGATSGDGPPSTAKVVASGDEARGPVLELSGDDATGSWRMITQTVPLTAERSVVVLSLWQRGLGLTLGKGQYHNANGTLEALDAAGKRLGPLTRTAPLSGTTAWTRATLRLVTPPGADAVRVGLFSSMTGRYQADGVNLDVAPFGPWRKTGSGAAWDALAAEVDATYPFEPLAAGRAAWSATAKARRDTAVAATTRTEFLGEVQKLLATLDDPHVVLTVDGKTAPTAAPKTPSKLWNFNAVKKRIAKPLFGRAGFSAALLDNGLGYIQIGSWARRGDGSFPMNEIQSAIDGLVDAKGIIVDVRTNQGGDESLARQVAARFAKSPVRYAKQRYRTSEGWGPWKERMLEPSDKPSVKGKVVVLQSAWCMSSNEGFLAMAKALPNVQTVGVTSRGATSNPQPLPLFSDVTAVTSRWQAALMDGTLIERNGIAPDIVVDAPANAYRDTADPILERAMALLLDGRTD